MNEEDVKIEDLTEGDVDHILNEGGIDDLQAILDVVNDKRDRLSGVAKMISLKINRAKSLDVIARLVVDAGLSDAEISQMVTATGIRSSENVKGI